MDLPRNVTSYVDRLGHRRYRFRKTGRPAHYFSAAPGTEAFDRELEACRGAPRSVPEARPIIGRAIRTINRQKRLLDKKRERLLANREPARRQQFIYFAAAIRGPIKIGLSANPKARLIEMQTLSPFELRLIVTTPGDRAAEIAYHERFAEHRLRGEWFKRHPEIIAEIGRIKAQKRAKSGGLCFSALVQVANQQ